MTEPTGQATCELCGKELASSIVEAASGAVFCSAGCRDIHVTLDDDGDTLDDDGDTPDARDTRGYVDDPGAPIRTGSRSDDDITQTFFRVDGMYSATCEAFLESVARSQDGVTSVDASYITETVRVDHDSARISGAGLRDVLTTLGYTAYLRTEARADADDSGSATRKARERQGLRKRRDEQFLGLRYAAGILFGAFLLLPYVTILYPVYLAALFDGWIFEHFRGAFQLEGPGGFLFLRIYFVMTGVVVFFTGLPVLRGAYVSLRMRQPTTDLLVAGTVLGAYLYSTLAVLLGHSEIYYDLTIVVVAAVTAAGFYEAAVKKRALARLTDLTVSQVETARRLDPEGTTDVSVEDVTPDDAVVVREGERVPVTGTLRDGECIVSEAVVTGESLPIEKTAGDEIVAGSVVRNGAAVVRVDDRTVSDLDRITAAMWDIQSADHGGRRRADRLAARVVPLVAASVITSGILAFVLGGGLAESVLLMLLVAFVVGPWALGLATPLSVARSLEEALDAGIVIFDETVFERLREIDVVVFDKTGTLTTGEMTVVDVECPEALLEAAVALERRASHPVAVAIVETLASTEGGQRAVADRADSDPRRADPGGDVEEFQTHGTGVEGVVDGSRALVGTPELFAERDWRVDEDLASQVVRARERGLVPTLVGRDGTAEGIIVVGDEPREEWTETVSGLAEQGIDVVVLTGDHEDATAFLEAHDGVTHVFAGVSPDAKAEAVRRLTADQQVAMVGDGTNDAMALATADLGLSLGSGTALAADAADITILDDDIAGVEAAFTLARAARRRIGQTTSLAFLYNLLVIPLAVAGLLNPVFAMLAVVLTSGLIGVNTIRPLR